MNAASSWDFRDDQELAMSQEYNKEGYIIDKGNPVYLELIKADIEKAFAAFSDIKGRAIHSLEDAHLISPRESNDLRLHIMNTVFGILPFFKVL